MIALARLEHPDLSVRRLCAMLGVGRSWYYEQPAAPAQAERDIALRDAIERLVLEFPGYGYRRVAKALQREGWAVNHKRVLRMMRQEALLCQLKRRVDRDRDHAGRDGAVLSERVPRLAAPSPGGDPVARRLPCQGARPGQ